MIYVCTDIELYCGQIKGAPQNRSPNLAVNQINCLENQHVDLYVRKKRIERKKANYNHNRNELWYRYGYYYAYSRPPPNPNPQWICATVFFLFSVIWIGVLLGILLNFCWIFVGFWLDFCSCCVFIFLEAHYLTAALN